MSLSNSSSLAVLNTFYRIIWHERQSRNNNEVLAIACRIEVTNAIHYCIGDEDEPIGISLEVLNVEATTAVVFWNFSSAYVNSYMLLDPVDVPPRSFSTQERSTELQGLVPGTLYQIRVFPFLGNKIWSSPKIGDPLSITFETKLEKPLLTITEVGIDWVLGNVSIFSHVVLFEVILLDRSFEKAKLVSKSATLVWRFDDLLDLQIYSVVMKVWTNEQMISSETLTFVTKAPVPYLKDQVVNLDARTVEVILDVSVRAVAIEYKIECDETEEAHNETKRSLLIVETTAEQFACRFRTRTIGQSEISEWFVFAVGIAILEDFQISKTSNVGKVLRLSWSVRAGLYSHIGFEYQGEGMQEINCTVGAFECLLAPATSAGKILRFNITVYHQEQG